MRNISPRVRTILPHGIILACCLAPAVAGLQTRAPGQAQILTLTPEQREILSHLSIVYLDDGQGGTAKTIRLSGSNFQIMNGLDTTNGNPVAPYSVDPLDVITNGTGNLIIGYNEQPQFGAFPGRTGSHNIEVGSGNGFSSFGGVVGGLRNTISGPFASATAGIDNMASGIGSSVGGGGQNIASGAFSTVGGGVTREAMIDGGNPPLIKAPGRDRKPEPGRYAVPHPSEG